MRCELSGTRQLAEKGYRQGDRILVSYEPAPAHLHERVLRLYVGLLQWVVCTPHWDLYEENLEEYLTVEAHPGFGRSVLEPLRAAVRFNDIELADRWDRLVQRARAAAQAIGVPATCDCTGGSTIPASQSWVTSEARYELGAGVAVSGTSGTLHPYGDRCHLALADGAGDKRIAIHLVGSKTAADDDEDLRTLPVRYLRPGLHHRSFDPVCGALISTVHSNLPISGPHCAQRLCEAIAGQNTTPSRRHHWWRTCLGVTQCDPGIEEHLFLSELIETAISFDQINVGELAMFESIARRFQLWEQFYADRLANREGGGSFEAEERLLFMGQGQSRALSLVSPKLREFMAKELSDKSAILKERRKAREERAMAADGKGAVKGKPADGDKQDPKGKAKAKP